MKKNLKLNPFFRIKGDNILSIYNKDILKWQDGKNLNNTIEKVENILKMNLFIEDKYVRFMKELKQLLENELHEKVNGVLAENLLHFLFKCNIYKVYANKSYIWDTLWKSNGDSDVLIVNSNKLSSLDFILTLPNVKMVLFENESNNSVIIGPLLNELHINKYNIDISYLKKFNIYKTFTDNLLKDIGIQNFIKMQEYKCILEYGLNYIYGITQLYNRGILIDKYNSKVSLGRRLGIV